MPSLPTKNDDGESTSTATEISSVPVDMKPNENYIYDDHIIELPYFRNTHSILYPNHGKYIKLDQNIIIRIITNPFYNS